jgi:hypothetical protein
MTNDENQMTKEKSEIQFREELRKIMVQGDGTRLRLAAKRKGAFRI